MILTLGKQALNIAPKFALISGSARSGTTIMGRLMASCHNTEYRFEPPLLTSLYALLDSLPQAQWKLLHDTYLYEEILMGGLSGRSLNTNKVDDSSSYKYLSEEVIATRLSRSLRRKDIESNLSSNPPLIAYKMPDLVPYLNTLKAYYPSCKIITMRRKLLPTLNSLLQKKWFSIGLAGDMSNQIFPSYDHKCESLDAINLPYWLPKTDFEWWAQADEINRSVYYYFCNTPDDCEFFTVDYEEFLVRPQAVFDQLSEYLNLSRGPKTEQIIASIRPQETSYNSNKNTFANLDIQSIIQNLPQHLRKKVENMSYKY